MHFSMDRRGFLGSIGAALGFAQVLPAATPRRLKIGHTGITWGFKPDDAAQAIHDVGSLGYAGYESFGEVIEAWESKGGIKRLLDSNELPLISAYCNVNLTDPTKRKEETDKIVRWAKLIQKCGGATAVVGPNGVKRSAYDFKVSKADIVAALNEMCKAVTDVGVIAALHQHTGTCIESRDEVYAVLEAVDTRYVKFGPDVGQLAKGGADPIKIVKTSCP
jgi:inosose dehydratase